ncbi:MAG TPA: hypothetical protein IAB02_05605 [Candidatus Pullichristensenella excrementigallinarum]|uniref:Spore cortex biosynthesis protein YabQ n=1 Tax=Candidatus Pullichristensenella excrementigallinarum TaxID=2840907 RepID=A0A9D1IBQ5_9FIRM|nr:hypothetical protein [Candidatus Pullichristensenella excrementigallinarum]
MLFATIGQWKVFAAMCLAGVLVGVWFSLLRLLRRLLSAGFWLTLLADLAFGAGAAAILALGLTLSCYGQVRLYSFLAAGLGAGIWLAGPHALGQRIFRRILPKFRQAARAIAHYRLFKVIFK